MLLRIMSQMMSFMMEDDMTIAPLALKPCDLVGIPWYYLVATGIRSHHIIMIRLKSESTPNKLTNLMWFASSV